MTGTVSRMWTRSNAPSCSPEPMAPRKLNPPSPPLRVSRQATAPEQGCWCVLCLRPFVPLGGLRSGFHRRRLAQRPSERLPVSYGPGAGPLARPSPVLLLRLPRGGWYGVSMCPAPSHTRTVGSFVGPPRRLLNDRNLSPLHPLPPLGLILFYWRGGLFAECHLMTGPLLPRHIFA